MKSLEKYLEIPDSYMVEDFHKQAAISVPPKPVARPLLTSEITEIAWIWILAPRYMYVFAFFHMSANRCW